MNLCLCSNCGTFMRMPSPSKAWETHDGRYRRIYPQCKRCVIEEGREMLRAGPPKIEALGPEFYGEI